VDLRAGGAKPLVPVESFIGFPVAFAQRFNALHFLIVFFRAGKELKQTRPEQFIRLGRFLKKFLATRT
jgi:hypothetical protein